MDNQVHTVIPEPKVTVTSDDQELNYWSNEFGIAKEELIAVVKRGGTFAAAVENYVMRLKVAL